MAHSVGAAEERRSRIVASAHCRFLLRFLGRLDENAIHARRQEASEKRQGTKSREVWHPTVQERLWGIRHVDCGADRGREALGAILGRWECEAGREQLEGGQKHGGSGGLGETIG